MSDIPHAHNTKRSMGHVPYTDRTHKLHWLSDVKFVACGRPMEKVDFTDDDEKWSSVGEGKRCRGCVKKKPPRTR